MSSGATRPAWEAAALADLARLVARLDLRWRRDEPLARHTSMGVGGPCPLMIWPTRAEHVRSLAGWMGRRGLTWRALGGGSNLLVSDAGVAEPVLNTGLLAAGDVYDEPIARLPAGLPMAAALRRGVRSGCDGLVWAAGLPGTVGGAAAGNAGCWGSDMSESVVALELVDGRGEPHRLRAVELDWGYRSLELPARITAPALITMVEVRLVPGDAPGLEARYLELQERKRDRQPVGARNSGCIFRNPTGEQTAGQLIDGAGCKGMVHGGIEVSTVHANFLVNRGAGSATEVLELVETVRNRVREQFGIALEPEIRRW